MGEDDESFNRILNQDSEFELIERVLENAEEQTESTSINNSMSINISQSKQIYYDDNKSKQKAGSKKPPSKEKHINFSVEDCIENALKRQQPENGKGLFFIHISIT